MKIDKIEIEGFGKLTSFSLELNEGFNFIYGDNESGKSTLCDFLLCMFYDVPNDGKKLGLSEAHRRKYKPWNGGRFGGKVYFTENGKSYILEKSFGATKRTDKSKLLDGDTWEELGNGENLGERLFGLRREGFLKTLYLSSYGYDGGKEGAEEILKRLSNLETTGDEDISYQSIKAALEKEQYALVTKTGKGGKIAALKEQEEALHRERYRFLRFQETQKEDRKQQGILAERLRELQNNITTTEQEYQTAVAHETYLSHQQTSQAKETLEKRRDEVMVSLENVEHQYVSAKNNAISLPADVLQKAKELEKELEIARFVATEAKQKLQQQQAELKAKKEKRKHKALVIALVIAVLFGVVGGVLMFVQQLFALLAFSLAPIAAILVYFFVKRNRKNENTAAQKKHLEVCEQRLLRANKNTEALLKTYEVDSLQALFFLGAETKQKEDAMHILKNKQAELKRELESLEHSLAQLPQEEMPVFDDTAIAYTGDGAEVLHMRLVDLQQQAETTRDKHYGLSLQLAKQSGETRTLDEIETELLTVTEQLAVLEKRYNALQKAGEWLALAHEEIKSNYAPRLNQKISEIFGKLTHAKYENVRLTEDFQMHYQNEQNEIVEAEHLSSGTYDLLYIALRLAEASVLFETVPVMILDDAFLQLDDTRLLAASTYLQNNPMFSQVLYFSCHKTAATLFSNENVTQLKL